MRNLKCLRCDVPMSFAFSEKIQLGQTGWLLGDLPNLISGALEVDIYACPQCGKLEFYQSETEDNGDNIQQVKCPKCGKSHDMDYPKCPFCRYEY